MKSTFEFTCRLLRAGGVFVFDVNTEAAYRSEWTKSSALVDPDAALFVRGGFDETARVGRTRITMFRLLEGWQRLDVEVVQRCYDAEELGGWLLDAGFRDAEIHGAAAIGMSGDLARGRVFLSATK